MPQKKGAHRFFSDYYDSIYQRGYGPKCRDDNDERVRVLGRMRLDSMLASKLVILDTQLLDGSFLLDQRPGLLLSLLTRVDSDEHPPIEVRSRSKSLQDALVGFVVPSKRHPVELKDVKLKGFSFSSIESNEERTAAKQKLEQTDATKVNSWEDIGPLLKSFGVAKDNVERMEEGWRRWIQAQKDDLLEVKEWEGKFELDEHLPRPDTLKQRLDTDQAKDTLAYVYETRAIRNSVDTRLTELREENREKKKVLEELDIIDAWFNRGYNATAMHQHNCTSFESVRDQKLMQFENSDDKHIAFRDGTSAALLNSIELEGVDLFHQLGIMPNAKFTSLFGEEGNIKNFQVWWNGGDADALNRGLEPFSEALTEGLEPFPEALTEKRVSPEIELGRSVFYETLGFIPGFRPTMGIVKAVVTYCRIKKDTHIASKELTQRILQTPSKELTQKMIQIAQARDRRGSDR